MLPLAVICVMIAAVGMLVWTGLYNLTHPNWHPGLAYAGDLNSQRHLASCYTTGCVNVPKSPLLACAWREIIVEELDAPTNLDIEEATATCRGLSESDRRAVAIAETDIRVQLHRAVRKH